MRIGGGGSQDINLLLSDTAQFRNEDFVVNSGDSFMHGLGQGALAAEFGHIQLKNPTGSGVVAFVDQLIVSSPTTQDILILRHAADLTGTVSLWRSTRLGGADGLSGIRRQTNASFLGTQIGLVRVTAGVTFRIEFLFPVQLDANTGLVAAAGVVNTGLNAYFFGREV